MQKEQMADGELTDEAHTSVDWRWSNEQDQQGTWNHVVIAELDPCPYARPDEDGTKVTFDSHKEIKISDLNDLDGMYTDNNSERNTPQPSNGRRADVQNVAERAVADVQWQTCSGRTADVQASDEVAEWLRRWTANPLCSARVGSNPILVV
ncbi:hypothetical protein PO909_030473 [Leuciscus waleckii]